ncbi:MAG: radical SAM family heme chaperone HemW [Candidatus Krumholzibacteriia bacterium]
MMNDREIAGLRGGSAPGTSRDPGGPLPGLYIHVPFCKTKCPYCDFYSITSGTPVERWLEALASEATRYRGVFGTFDTLYIGGGTPSLLREAETARLFEILTDVFDLAAGSETTIEANPDDVTPRAIADWRGLGINRVSLGVQSFDDGALRFLRRRHDASRAREALALFRETGFSNIGIDLIYGFEGQSIDLWRRTLEYALEYRPEHLSCYQMMIERSTEFGAMIEAGSLAAIDEETQRAFFMETSAILTARGYVHYEISNFARGEELLSRHNRKYWNRLPYLGLGPSAHSFRDGKRWWNARSVESYCRLLERGESAVEDSETLGDDEIALETLFLGFRTRDGVPLEALRRYPGWERTLEPLVDAGLVTIADGRAAPTVSGFCVADRLAAAFVG